MLVPPSTIPAEQRAGASVSLRYEDIVQDGRMRLEALPLALSEAVWRGSLAEREIARVLRDDGVMPILARMVLEGFPGPFPIHTPMAASGAYEVAHEVDASGNVDRLLLNMWGELRGEIGRTYGPPPDNAGQQAVAGRVFAQHVFTKLFAPPAERKVRSFNVPNFPSVPPTRSELPPFETVLQLPDGATPLEDDLVADPMPIVFGVRHTDSNQHVNSLEYPRLFEEAAVRRAFKLGETSSRLARSLEVGFRKPCFPGEAMEVRLRAFRLAEAFGVVGILLPANASVGTKANAYARVLLYP